MSVVADIANEGGPHVCRAQRAACATSANRPVPGRQLPDHCTRGHCTVAKTPSQASAQEYFQSADDL